MKDMDYRLVIVDDDEEIRNGLAEIVDWKSCGFAVAAVLKDGEEAIRYLDRQPADAVLSDIRMTYASGLSVAKHISERGLPARIVLISGFQEFELAKEALRYNVFDYLLKPTDLDEVYRVFRALKEQLDRDRADRERIEQDKEMWGYMMRFLKERYLPHLLFETLADEEEMTRQFEMIGLPLDPRSCASAVVLASGGSGAAGFSPESAWRVLLQSAEESSAVALFPIGGSSADGLRLLAVAPEADKRELASDVGAVLRRADVRLRNLFGYGLEWRIEQAYDAMADFLAEHRERRKRSETKAGFDAPAGQWEADKRLWLAYVEEGKFEEAERLLERVLAACGEGRIDTIKLILIQWFGSLDSVYASDSGSALLMRLCRAEEPEEAARIGASLLQEMSRGRRGEPERMVITQAKRYVREHAGKDIGLQEVADHVYLNPVYLSRLFKLETGKSFTEYVTETRMEQAAQLLRETNMKIYEVCEQAGYKDVRHFYKLFKKHYGRSPSEYREGRS